MSIFDFPALEPIGELGGRDNNSLIGEHILSNFLTSCLCGNWGLGIIWTTGCWGTISSCVSSFLGAKLFNTSDYFSYLCPKQYINLSWNAASVNVEFCTLDLPLDSKGSPRLECGSIASKQDWANKNIRSVLISLDPSRAFLTKPGNTKLFSESWPKARRSSAGSSTPTQCGATSCRFWGLEWDVGLDQGDQIR